ncbi:hypothetical protein [Actinoplanes sp. NPDC020271]|uniref:hypothetical protein n=1 Tax=Actinoplanes sp. NPDC020271 TaxID=3363896 RepID=UPI0037970B95
MPNTKITKTALDELLTAAQAAGVDPKTWLATAVHTQAVADEIKRSNNADRVLLVPVSRADSTVLDRETDRTMFRDWSLAARYVHQVAAEIADDPDGVRRAWEATLADLDEMTASKQQRHYLRQAQATDIVGSTVLIDVPDAYTRDVIELRLRPALAAAMSRHLRRPVQVAVTLRPEPDPDIVGTVTDPSHTGITESAGTPSSIGQEQLVQLLTRPDVASRVAAVIAAANG